MKTTTLAPLFSTLLILSASTLIDPISSTKCPKGSVHINLLDNQWSCFKFVKAKKEFFTADLDCQQQKGHLVSIHNAFDNFYIAEHANYTFGKNADKYWIGVNQLQNDTWTFSDTSKHVLFFDWAVRQPKENAGKIRCASSDLRGYWYSDDCFDYKHYVCELPSVEERQSTKAEPPTPTTVPYRSKQAPRRYSPTTRKSVKPPPTVVPRRSISCGPPSHVSKCESNIPFCIDFSQSWTFDEFASLKDAILDPFLKQLVPSNVTPAHVCIFDQTMRHIHRQSNTSEVVRYVQNLAQGPQPSSNFEQVLHQLFSSKILDKYTNKLPVNTVIFGGSSIHADSSIKSMQKYVDYLTAEGNTLTAILSPKIDQTRYLAFKNLNIISCANPLDSVHQLRNVMNCKN